MATATAEVRVHEKIPYIKIAKLYGEGLTIIQIAKKVGRYNEGYADPTKSVRSILSRMNTAGYYNENGKLVHLKLRGHVQKASKASKTPKAVKAVKTQVTGKAIAIMVTADGKHVKIDVPSLTNLIPIDVFESKISKVLDAISDAHIAAEVAPEGSLNHILEQAAVVEPVVEQPSVEVVPAPVEVVPAPVEVVTAVVAEPEEEDEEEPEVMDSFDEIDEPALAMVASGVLDEVNVEAMIEMPELG